MPATSSTPPGSCLPGLVSVVGTIVRCITASVLIGQIKKKPFFTHNHCSFPRVSGQTDSDVSLHDVQRSGHGRLAASNATKLALIQHTDISKWVIQACRAEAASAAKAGGARRDRTDDILLAKQALSQLSYGPIRDATNRKEWWARVDSNYRPHAYQACALTT